MLFARPGFHQNVSCRLRGLSRQFKPTECDFSRPGWHFLLPKRFGTTPNIAPPQPHVPIRQECEIPCPRVSTSSLPARPSLDDSFTAPYGSIFRSATNARSGRVLRSARWRPDHSLHQARFEQLQNPFFPVRDFASADARALSRNAARKRSICIAQLRDALIVRSRLCARLAASSPRVPAPAAKPP